MEATEQALSDLDRWPWLVRVRGTGGHVVGAGFLVDERHVLTCAHVVNAAIGVPGQATERPTATVMLEFVDVDGDSPQAARIPARVLPDGWVPIEHQRGDVAVLALQAGLPTGAAPAPLRRPPRLRGHRFDATGFPRGGEHGVTASGEISRPAGPGREWVQLQGVEVPIPQVERGFSGTPVWDRAVGAVVGMVVAEQQLTTAKVGWMLPIHVLVDRWPPLDAVVRAGLLYEPGEGETHWGPRARGVERDRLPGWYFTGRVQVLRALVSWLAGERADGQVRVVTGGPGSGKSAVLARLVTLSDPGGRAQAVAHGRLAQAAAGTLPPPGAIDVAVLARGKTPLQVLAAVAHAAEIDFDLGLDRPAASPDQGVGSACDLLVERLLERGRSLTVVVDALDEAGDPPVIAQALRTIAVDAARVGVRVLVATRPGPQRILLTALGHARVEFDLKKFADSSDMIAVHHRDRPQ